MNPNSCDVFFIKALKEVPLLPLAGEDRGPVEEPPVEGDGEEPEAEGNDPLGPHHHQPRLQHLLTAQRDPR